MNKIVKSFLTILNLIIIAMSIYWFLKPASNIKPITVFISQLISLIALYYGDKIVAAFHIKDISNSEVKIDTDTDDNSQYKISRVKDGSKINIKKH
ncbi:UNVERIFIED_CONTAM: hypothetical protein POZ17_17535 [Ralstonia mannitolilytica]